MRRGERAENAVQALLTVGVGGVAGAAAWSHVVALATAHGQPGWLAWADAAVIETLAVSAGLEIRRRRRGEHPVTAVAAVLVAAVVLSLACQVATAQPTAWGWVMAAVPAVGFLAMAKIALGRPAGRTYTTGRTKADGRDGHLPGVREPADQEQPAGADRHGSQGPQVTHDGPAQRPVRHPEVADQVRTSPAPVRAEVEPYNNPQHEWDALLWDGLAVLADLERSGVTLSRTSLVNGLRARQVQISTDRASRLLRELRGLSRADRDRLHDSVNWTEVAR